LYKQNDGKKYGKIFIQNSMKMGKDGEENRNLKRI
jgi:hypothetical protein